MKTKYLLWALPFMASSLCAQRAVEIAEGYYTMSPFEKSSQSYVYSYDTDALRAPYGNAADYDHPCGRNGEVAYLYCVPTTSVALTSSAYYFKPLASGGYSVQSLSGQAYSYLGMAGYDRHLIIHTPMPTRPFYTRMSSEAEGTGWPADERVVQPFRDAALCDSMIAAAHSLSSMIVLTRVDSSRITPAMSLRRALSDARGAMAVYRVGDNPGEVSPLVAHALQQAVDEALVMVEDKNTTQPQADAMTATLQEATASYLQSAPSVQTPLSDGYYFVVNAYRAFMARQNKEKVLTASPADDGRTLTWGDINVNSGSVAFHLTAVNGNLCQMKSYDQSLDMGEMKAQYDSEGTWTLARSSAPEALMTAANHSTGTNGLYAKNTTGSISFDPQGHLYSGYTASWYLRRAYHQLTVPSSGWAVLGCSFPVELPEGVEAYSVVSREGNLYLRPYAAAVIPACTAVVIRAARGTYTFPSVAHDAPAIPDNVLVPVCEARKGIQSGSMRTLKVKNGVAGFARVSSTSVNAGSAYVPCMEGEPDFLPLSDLEDAIQSLPAAQQSTGDAYDLQGRKAPADHQRAGDIYIINNKKILKR